MAKCNDCLKENPHRHDRDYICGACISLRVQEIEQKKQIQAGRTTIQPKLASQLLPDPVDPINPTHYKTGGIECIDAMQSHFSQEEFRGFLRGNSFKYRWRYRQKKGVEDLKKAEWYEKKLLELESKVQ